MFSAFASGLPVKERITIVIPSRESGESKIASHTGL
jgi:hypothetical protein